jgi:hypothetical protein
VLVVGVRHETCATTRDACAKNANVTAAKATHVASAEAAAHMAAAAATTSGLCTRYKKAPGKHSACQQHYHSSCHDILHSDWRIVRHSLVRRRRVSAERTPTSR